MDPTTRRPAIRLPAAWPICLLTVLTLACPAEPPKEEHVTDAGVAAPQIGLRFTAIPDGLTLVSVGATVELEAPDNGRLVVSAGEHSDYGIDVTQIANQQREAFQDLEQGEFLGARRLMLPLGEGSYARGHYVASDQLWEEVRGFAVHPTENRLVTFTYTYPASDDSATRVQTLLDLMGNAEAYEPNPPEPTP